MNKTHEAVMVEEVLAYLLGDRSGNYVDCTFGAGGHSTLLLKSLENDGSLVGLDKDPEVEQRIPRLLKDDKRFSFINDSFSNLPSHIEENSLDGILIDLGISSTQLDEAGRGFSFQDTGPLDMRMNQKEGLSAEQWINSASQKEIESVLWELGEERASRKIAKIICDKRVKRPIESTQDLVDIILSCLPRRGKKHPATNVFRAIRMQVNHELEELYAVLESAGVLLKTGGRIAVISFHSIEDRVVKRFLQGKDRISSTVSYSTIGGKHIKPSREEIRSNPRSRSAILRVAEKAA
jgi:16S rRNA (cytosine1402-N4)-methyltransferase